MRQPRCHCSRAKPPGAGDPRGRQSATDSCQARGATALRDFLGLRDLGHRGVDAAVHQLLQPPCPGKRLDQHAVRLRLVGRRQLAAVRREFVLTADSARMSAETLESLPRPGCSLLRRRWWRLVGHPRRRSSDLAVLVLVHVVRPFNLQVLARAGWGPDDDRLCRWPAGRLGQRARPRSMKGVHPH